MAESFFSNFQIDRSLGTSHFSRVYLATEMATGKQVALKVLLKPQKAPGEDDPIPINHDAITSPDIECPHLVTVTNLYEDIHMIVIVMEFVSGGELFEWLLSRGSYSEAGVSIIINHLLVALQILHSHGIVHRNIKPENILVADNETGATIKLSDFGLARTIDSIDQLSALCGTEVCSSPEIFKAQEYGPPTDIWSLGVIAYMLLSGVRPFEEDQKYPLFMKVVKEPPFNEPQWENVSKEAQDLVRRMLVVDPAGRIPVEQALNHPWIQNPEKDEPLDVAYRKLQVTMMGRKVRRAMGASKSAASFRQFTRLTQRPE